MKDDLNTYILPPIEVTANRDYTYSIVIFISLLILVGLRK